MIDIIEKDGFTFYKPTFKKKTDSSESVEQINYVNWIRENHPNIVFFAVVNERKSNAKDMEKLKRQGLVTGIPDLYLSLNGKSIFIEMKKHNGIFSHFRASQRTAATDLMDSGQVVVVCFGMLAAIIATEEFIKLCSKTTCIG